MDVDAIIRAKPQVCVVDELAHSNVPGSRNEKRYQDVLEILDAGIHVMTAVNIQHLETLNDAVARVTGVRVRETVPDTFFDRADEVINVDVTVEELRNRLREGKVYRPEKVEQALSNFFRKGNLSTLRELALARRGRRSRREGGELSRSRGTGAGADSRARDGVHELEPHGAARDPHGRAHRRPPRREVVCRVRGDTEGAARARRAAVHRARGQHQARRKPRRDGRPRHGRSARRRPGRICPARRRHARDLRPERAQPMGS